MFDYFILQEYFRLSFTKRQYQTEKSTASRELGIKCLSLIKRSFYQTLFYSV
jgi:hypothetical protein